MPLEKWMRRTRLAVAPCRIRQGDRLHADALATITCFLDDGRICLINNVAERALRGIALGRRAWLFAGSDRGGERAARHILAYCLWPRLNGVDPQAWLADVLHRIADHPASRLYKLLPWNWKQPAPQTAAA